MPRVKALAGQYAAEAFRREIRMALAELDMTQKELSVRIGVAEGTMCNRLHKPENFTVKELRALRRALPLAEGAIERFIQEGV